MASCPTISVRLVVHGLEELTLAMYRASAAMGHLSTQLMLDRKARAVRRLVLWEIRKKFAALNVDVQEMTNHGG